jgi:hypothetical protein
LFDVFVPLTPKEAFEQVGKEQIKRIRIVGPAQLDALEDVLHLFTRDHLITRVSYFWCIGK